MEEQLRRVINSKDVINQIDLVSSNTGGIYLVTIISKEDVIYFKKKKTLLTIEIENFGKYNIIQPLGSDTWDSLDIGDTFILSKDMFKDKKTHKPKVKLIIRYILTKNGIDRNIEQVDISNIEPNDRLYPRVIKIAILKQLDNELLMFANNYVYKVKANFVFKNVNNIDVTFGKFFYIDIEKNNNSISILSTNFKEARESIYNNTGMVQSKEDRETFNVATESKDRYIDFTKISNIDLMGRDYSGLMLMDIVNVTTSNSSGEERRYIDVIVNSLRRLTLKIPERKEWQNLKSNQSLLVDKNIHTSNDGKNLALLDVILKIDNFNDQMKIDLESLTKHKYGLMNYVQFHFIKKIDDYFIVHSRGKLEKVNEATLPNEISKGLAHGFTRFFSKNINNAVCYGREETLRIKLCK